MTHLTYRQERLLCKAMLQAAGMPEQDADLVGEVVTYADFTGVSSHGLSRLLYYLREIRAGGLNPCADFQVTRDAGSVLSFDCDNGSGILGVRRAYAQLSLRAWEHGIAIGTGKRSSNVGCAGFYGLQAASDGLICLFCANTHVCMAPYGGAEKLIGTNPIVASVPAEGCQIVLDMSTSGVAFGKITALAREGLPIPPGWANDYDGRPTTDGKLAYTVLPVGGHKGYGLAVMVDLFSAVLAGAAYGNDIGIFKEFGIENTGFCMILIDPEKWMPLSEFRRQAVAYRNMLKQSRRAEGVSEIFLPGEIERRKLEELKNSGISVPDALTQELGNMAQELDLIPEANTFADFLAAL